MFQNSRHLLELFQGSPLLKKFEKQGGDDFCLQVYVKILTIP